MSCAEGRAAPGQVQRHVLVIHSEALAHCPYAASCLQSQPVDVLPGVGGKIGQQLGEKGVKTVADLLVSLCARILCVNRHRGVPPRQLPIQPRITCVPCCALQARSREWVQAELGPKAGAQLYDYAQGKDERWAARCASCLGASHAPAAPYTARLALPCR